MLHYIYLPAICHSHKYDLYDDGNCHTMVGGLNSRRMQFWRQLDSVGALSSRKWRYFKSQNLQRSKNAS